LTDNQRPIYTPRVTPDLLERASRPALVVQAGGLAALLAEVPSGFLLLTQPEPLGLLPPDFVRRAAATTVVASLDADWLDGLLRDLPSAAVVVGIGGGMAMDAAKFVSWRRSIPLQLVPSIVSVDACVTNTAAVRVDGHVRYQGFVVAERIIVDPDFVRGAPRRLNRAGIGDLVSIHTALWDWERGAAVKQAVIDTAIADEARAVFGRIECLADDVAAVSDRGIEGTLSAYAQINAMCLRLGHSQPEEGSEHYFAYNVEKLTGRSFVHGELVGLGTVLMAALQGNDPSRVIRMLDRALLEWRPTQLRLDDTALRSALTTLRAFVAEMALPYSIATETDLSMDRVDALMIKLNALLA
jgi:glycerol-1-phosphate dehydrogenase [NAD(P)+]